MLIITIVAIVTILLIIFTEKECIKLDRELRENFEKKIITAVQETIFLESMKERMRKSDEEIEKMSKQ